MAKRAFVALPLHFRLRGERQFPEVSALVGAPQAQGDSSFENGKKTDYFRTDVECGSTDVSSQSLDRLVSSQ